MNEPSMAIDDSLVKSKIFEALAAGVDRVSAWADLLDSINVFPVADGDTGRNLVISLQPLKQSLESRDLIEALLMSARGNSGNIAAQFFSAFVLMENLQELNEFAEQGRILAWKAVREPKSGTMLSFFDALVDALHRHDVVSNPKGMEQVLDILERMVVHTSRQLKELASAGVVDAGALGMFIFFDGFFNVLFNRTVKFRSIAEIFENLLHVDPSWRTKGDDGYCIDAVLKMGSKDEGEDSISVISEAGHEVVAMGHGDFVKVHLHAADEAGAKRKLEGVGHLVNWKSDDLKAQMAEYLLLPKTQALHIMSDAAGSITRTDAKRLGITLLESYINLGPHSYPETHMDPEKLYGEMRKGTPASTAQASVFERYQRYQQAASLYPRVLYLCVGAGYTGNYQAAMDWKASNDPDDKLLVVDTEAASGKLGLLAIATARFSLIAREPDSVVQYAIKARTLVEELIFIEKLQYLARGGRISKTGAFFGDMLHVKPVVSPAADGVKKVGVVRSKGQQISFALGKLKEALKGAQSPLIMLQYTDNRSLVEGEFKGAIESEFPQAEVFTQPLSLTTGTHCGPGAWAMAYLPEAPNPL